MKYKNLKTQAIIEVACEIKGGNWVLMEEPAKTSKPKKAKEVKKDG